MLRLTRKTDYALLCLACLAEHGASRDEPMSARSVAELYHLPLPQLMTVMKDLARAGVVDATRGAHGGYYLAHTPDKVTVLSVVEAIEGNIAMTPCCDDADAEPCQTCDVTTTCPIGDNIRRLNDRVADFFEQVTLRDLMTSRIHVGLPQVTISAGKD